MKEIFTPIGKYLESKKNLRESDKDFARRIGMSYWTLNRWRQGTGRPSMDKLEKAARILGVQVGELINLTNAPFNSTDKKPLDKSKDGGENVSVSYDKAGPGALKIPILGYVEAGTMKMFSDGDFPAGVADDYVYTNQRREHQFALRVHGDSMSPVFMEGDTIIVDPDIRPENGNTVVAKNQDGETVLKRLYYKNGMIVLSPINQDYDPIVCGLDEVEIIGKVIELRRKDDKFY